MILEDLLKQKEPSDLSKYWQECFGWSTYECEAGFVVYEYLQAPTFYIREIYIKPQFRKTKAATQLADRLCLEAKNLGYTQLIGSVSLSNKNKDRSMQVLHGYGMKFLSVDGGAMYFTKEIS